MNRPPAPGFYLRLVKLVLVTAAITSVIFLAALLSAWAGPRFAPVIVTGLLVAAVLAFLFRDRLIGPN